MTTLFATARQHFATILGAHALSKPVDALAASIVRLKGPLHRKFSSH
jgi:hypothetical protein